MPALITCYLVPALRVARRVVTRRPRIALGAAAATRPIRRAVRRPLLVCRDAGLLALAGTASGSAPATAPAPPAPPPAEQTGAGAGSPGGAGFDLAGVLGSVGGTGHRPRGSDPLPPGLLFGPEGWPPPAPPRPGDKTFTTAPPGPPPDVAVPEPPMAGLLLCAALAVVLLRRHLARG